MDRPLQLDPPFLPHGNGLFIFLWIVLEMAIFLFLIWTMTHILMSPPSAAITGEAQTATSSILTYTQDEKQAQNYLTMTVMVFSVLTIAVGFTKTNSALLTNVSVWQ